MVDFLYCDYIILLISGFLIKLYGGFMGVMGDYGGLVILVIECIRRVYICFIKISLFLEMFDWVIVYLWFRFFFGLLSGDWFMNE